MTLTVLGCSGSYPGPGAACSGYLVRGEGTTLWVDAGSGTMANLQRHVPLSQVDAVLLSHEHPDHWTDVLGFLVASTYGDERREGVPVYAPAGLEERAHVESFPTFAWHTVETGDAVAIGDVRVSFSRTDHGPETLAMRFDAGGRSLGYSADTGPGWSLEALGPGLDLALCEASYNSRRSGAPGHLTAAEAGRTGRESGAARLLLTHLWPTIDRDRSRGEASEVFGRAVELAEPNREYLL